MSCQWPAGSRRGVKRITPWSNVSLRQRSKGKKPDAPPRYRKNTIQNLSFFILRLIVNILRAPYQLTEGTPSISAESVELWSGSFIISGDADSTQRAARGRERAGIFCLFQARLPQAHGVTAN